MTATITILNPNQLTQQPELQNRKKCSGKCAKCKSKQLNANSVDSDSLVSDLEYHVNEKEMHGVEFDTGKHKRVWSGCFKGTRDF